MRRQAIWHTRRGVVVPAVACFVGTLLRVRFLLAASDGDRGQGGKGEGGGGERMKKFHDVAHVTAVYLVRNSTRGRPWHPPSMVSE